MNTRLATVADLPALFRMFDAYRRFYGYDGDSASSEQFIAERIHLKDSTLLVACDSELIGFAQLYPLFSSVSACRIMLLNDLFVREDYGNMGIGTMLLDASKVAAIAANAKRLLIATRKTNAAAARLYQNFGFVLDSEFDNFSMMLRSLPPTLNEAESLLPRTS